MAERKPPRLSREPRNGQVSGGAAGPDGEAIGSYESTEAGRARQDSQEKVLDYQRRLRDLALELSVAEERERRRVSSVLHDRVCQDLAAAKLRVGLLRRSAPSEDHARSLAEVEELLGRAADGAGALMVELFPPVLYEEGLESALAWLVRRFDRKDEASFDFTGDGRLGLLSSELGGLLFQVVRELLTNVVKHARARRVTVVAEAPAREVTITVGDDGVGFDPRGLDCRGDEAGRFGLFSIRERLRYLGGRLEIRARPGRGSRVTVIVPLQPFS